MRILIADDDSTSRILLKAVASKLGHDCVVAHDGYSAWGYLSHEEIDVLLSDWMMPGFDGPQLCRRVRSELSARYVYIVLITSLGQRDQVLEGMTAGADDYLVKPVDPFALRTRLVAAERVTMLHRQLVEIRGQLELANAELLGRSLTDPLTGLGNRRRMEEELGRVHEEAKRSGQVFSVALFDIDHFKLYNDHYGHQAGDAALREVALSFESTKRSGESMYRYGGEEFLLVLRGSAGAQAMTAATRFRESVVARAISHDVRPTSPSLLTVSGGVASWDADQNQSIAELIEQADQALFLSKSTGRNRIESAGVATTAA